MAGVLGDLSQASPPITHGTRVTLVIPPDTPRAHPLPPLPETAAAEAQTPRAPRPAAMRPQRREAVDALIKPMSQRLNWTPKTDLDLAAKPERHKGA